MNVNWGWSRNCVINAANVKWLGVKEACSKCFGVKEACSVVGVK